MTKQTKKCEVEGCNKPATNKMLIKTVRNNKLKVEQKYLCKKHYRSVQSVKDNLCLEGKTARIDFISLKNGKMGFYAVGYKEMQAVSIGLTKNDIKWILNFILRNY